MNYSFSLTDRNTLLINYVDHQEPTKTQISNHMHCSYELLYVISADASYIIEGRKYRLKKDDLIIVRPGNYHMIQFHSGQRYARYNVLFDPSVLGINNMHLLPETLDVLDCSEIPIITDLFRKVDYYRGALTDAEFADVLTLLLKEMVYNMGIHCHQTGKERQKPAHPLIRKALKIINENLTSIDNIGSIAQELFVSESYLYRLFRKELLITPQKYITEKRLLMAQKLLRSGKNATQVSLECGFSDYSVFYRSYQKHFGYKPSREQVETIGENNYV